MVWLRLAILYRIAYCIHLCDVCCLIVQYENVVLNLGTIPTGNNCSVMPSRQGSSRRLGGVQVQHSSLYRKRDSIYRHIPNHSVSILSGTGGNEMLASFFVANKKNACELLLTSVTKQCGVKASRGRTEEVQDSATASIYELINYQGCVLYHTVTTRSELLPRASVFYYYSKKSCFLPTRVERVNKLYRRESCHWLVQIDN